MGQDVTILVIGALIGATIDELVRPLIRRLRRRSLQAEAERTHQANLEREQRARDRDRQFAALRKLKASVDPLAIETGGWIGKLVDDGDWVPGSAPMPRWLHTWEELWEDVRTDLIDRPDVTERAGVIGGSGTESEWQRRVANPQEYNEQATTAQRRDAAIHLIGTLNAELGSLQATIDWVLTHD